MITTILTTYNRPHLLNEQIQAIQSQTIDSKIMVWMNKGKKPFNIIEDNNIIVSQCSHNMKFHSRFSFALNAQTEYVALFDDDTIPGPKWFENCINSIKKKDGIYGSVGIELTGNGYSPRKRHGWPSQNKEITQVHLVGHAWFMKTDYLKYLWYERPASFDNGEDIQLSYLAKKYAGINTYVPPHPKDQKELWGSIKAVEYGADDNASYKVNKNHPIIRDELCKKFQKEGWVL